MRIYPILKNNLESVNDLENKRQKRDTEIKYLLERIRKRNTIAQNKINQIKSESPFNNQRPDISFLYSKHQK